MHRLPVLYKNENKTRLLKQLSAHPCNDTKINYAQLNFVLKARHSLSIAASGTIKIKNNVRIN